jgi:3-oxoacyl-[acyl-carrier protein] reductase
MKNKLIIFGSSSYLCQIILNDLKKKYNIICFSSKNSSIKKNIKFVNTDYSNKNIFTNLKKFIKKNDKIIVIFFNGISEKNAFYTLKEKEINHILKINLVKPIIITNIILKNFLYNSPTFIYMSSSRAFHGDKGISVYSASKIALINFAKCLQLEYRGININFKVILLGLLKGGLKNILDKKKIKEIFNRSKIKNYITKKQILFSIFSAISSKKNSDVVIKCDNGYS